jgi:transposase
LQRHGKPFLNLIALRAKNALNILDRFHIAQKLSDAIYDVRAAETKELIRKGKEVVLKYSRWCFLKNAENMTANQKVKLKDLLKCNLKKIRASLSQTLEACDKQKRLRTSFVFCEKSNHFAHQLFKRSENN